MKVEKVGDLPLKVLHGAADEIDTRFRESARTIASAGLVRIIASDDPFKSFENSLLAFVTTLFARGEIVLKDTTGDVK